MGWASEYIMRLQAGNTVSFRPTGGSMTGIIESGQLVTVRPLKEDEPKEGDVVLCRVKDKEYLHLVKEIDINPTDGGYNYVIGNNKGGENGWVWRDQIFGIWDKNGPTTPSLANQNVTSVLSQLEWAEVEAYMRSEGLDVGRLLAEAAETLSKWEGVAPSPDLFGQEVTDDE